MGKDILVRNLSLYYETLQALSKVNMDFEFGKCTLIIGPNGAGKSSLLGCISGLIYDHIKRSFLTDERIGLTGNISFDNEDITNLSPSERVKRGIIHCPEERGLFPEMSVLDNLVIGSYLRQNRKKREIKEDIEKIFSFFPELKKLKHVEAGFSSGGEQQMLAIGRALIAEPKFLLLDEPFTGLAPKVQDRIREIISLLLENGETGIVISEQSGKILSDLSTRIYVLGRGMTVFEGGPEEVKKDEHLMTTYFV